MLTLASELDWVEGGSEVFSWPDQEKDLSLNQTRKKSLNLENGQEGKGQRSISFGSKFFLSFVETN